MCCVRRRRSTAAEAAPWAAAAQAQPGHKKDRQPQEWTRLTAGKLQDSRLTTLERLMLAWATTVWVTAA